MIAPDRLDIVLLAGTDSAGGSTAEYLARRSIAEPFSLGLAGQNRTDLKRLVRRLVSINPKMEGRIGIIVVDFSRSGSINSLAESASVLLYPAVCGPHGTSEQYFQQHEQLANKPTPILPAPLQTIA